MDLKGAVLSGVAVIGITACGPNRTVLRSVDGHFIDFSKNLPFQIINGQKVEPADPLSASIVGIFDTENKNLCTGSLLEGSYVLTAAHCVGRDPRNLRVFFGRDMESIVAVHPVSGARIPPYFGERFDHSNDWGDIAVLKFQGEIPEGYHPVHLLSKDVLQEGQYTLIAGYGFSDGSRKDGSGILRKTRVQIADPHFGDYEASLDQRSGTGACHGDSGGPAYLETEAGYFLWGVTSRSFKDHNDDCSQFAVYTNAIAYQDWIQESKLALLDK